MYIYAIIYDNMDILFICTYRQIKMCSIYLISMIVYMYTLYTLTMCICIFKNYPTYYPPQRNIASET